MSESPSSNAIDTKNENKPDEVILSNGTVLVAEKDVEGAIDEKDDVSIEEQAKGDLTKITSVEDSKSTSIPNGDQDIRVDGVVGENNTSTEDSSTEQPIPAETTKSDIPPITPIIAEPTLVESHQSQSDPIVRAATPSSRTSTPPLGSSALAKKKFSSVNVNQRFLSKAGSPAPTAGPTKISSLNGRPTISPAPTASSSSRLLSTKLTTVPTSKTSATPIPPSSASSSPWAKPVLPLPTESLSAASTPSLASTTPLHQPAPTRARVLGTTTTPAMGAGLVSATIPPKPVWKAVTGETRKPGLGISRDFPTAKEVAEGKKAAQMAQAAQAAHNQAILQELNTFTQLDPGTHRWDEEDEDDDVIDFGDGTGEHIHHLDATAHDLPIPIDQAVPKSERFAEDFDRSWPRRPPPQLEGSQTNPLSRRSETDNSRVLFNASSNRLENPRQAPAPTIQPTRLMSRPTDPSRQPPPHIANKFDRPLPPHLQGAPTGDRMLPPHMSNPPPESRSQAAPPPTRSAWNVSRENDRPLPPHLAERRELQPQTSAFNQSRSPEKQFTNLPPRRSFSQATGPLTSDIQPIAADPATTSPTIGVDAQTAEMHTAAEKAKARRLAEEAERDAAAERARRKAKELEERFKPASTNSEPKPVPSQPPPGPVKEIPQITLAQRPKPPHAEPLNHNHLALPSRPEVNDNHAPASSGRSAESSWRSRAQAGPSQVEDTPSTVISPPTVNIRSSRPTAESFFEDESGELPKVSILQNADVAAPKKDALFDDTLARIQAAMAEARSTAAAGAAEQSPLLQSPEVTSSQPRSSVTNNQSLPPKPTTMYVQEYFDVSYPEPPKSPPPAWRTYSIKLPKSHPSLPPIPRNRLSAAEGLRTTAPQGWLMSFNPPLDGVNSSSLSRSDLLLPQTLLRRFQRSEPVVSISPRQLELFEKKIKKKPSVIEASYHPTELPITSAESLLPAPTTLKSQSLRDQRSRGDDLRQAESTTTVQKPIPQSTEEPPRVEPPPRKTKSPVKNSAAAKAEREGRFVFDGVTIGAPEKERMVISDKPGVRFMVSSELEGDSLLDEVNKMSLETLDEDDKAQNMKGVEPVKTSGSETPKTPPLPRPASPNTSTWPSASLSYPASHSPARTSSQHDHNALKSVWDGQQTTTKPASDLNAAAPMYPSLNAPSSADPPAAQPLPAGGMKMAFSNSQTFSSPGAGPSITSTNAFGSLRPSPATHSQYGQYSTPSPDNANQHMMSYTSVANPRTNGFQQGVWSPTAFGTSMASPGYGYTAVPKSTTNMDHKSPVTMGYGGTKSSEQMVYPGYTNTSAAYVQQQQAQQQQYGVAAAGYGRGGVNQTMYYGYGAPGQQAQGVRPVGMAQQQQQQGRFAHANDEYNTQAQVSQQYNMDQGGYYGGLGGHHQSQQQSIYTNGASYGHPSHGAVGQNQTGRGGLGGTRKMW